jgi:hypothetical protein
VNEGVRDLPQTLQKNYLNKQEDEEEEEEEILSRVTRKIWVYVSTSELHFSFL